MHPSCLPIELLLRDCELQQTRRGGPGGQHRNKTESAIVLTHRPTGITGQASERRSQHENRDVAIERLRTNLALAVRSELDEERRPSELWNSRKRSRQIAVNANHVDFPALLAEALDFLNFDQFEVGITAERLGITSSQLIRFLKLCPAAFKMLNGERMRRGLRSLK